MKVFNAEAGVFRRGSAKILVMADCPFLRHEKSVSDSPPSEGEVQRFKGLPKTLDPVHGVTTNRLAAPGHRLYPKW